MTREEAIKNIKELGKKDQRVPKMVTRIGEAESEE